MSATCRVSIASLSISTYLYVSVQWIKVVAGESTTTAAPAVLKLVVWSFYSALITGGLFTAEWVVGVVGGIPLSSVWGSPGWGIGLHHHHHSLICKKTAIKSDKDGMRG